MSLNLLPTQEILNELKCRFDHMVFKGLRQKADKEKRDVAMFDWYGEHAVCLGLCEQIKHDINKDSDSQFEKLEEMP
jgi:hypothetical protein